MDSLFVRGSWIKMDQRGKNKVSLERSKENMWLCCIFIAFHPSGARKKTGTHLQDLRIALKRLIHGISVEVQTKSNKNFISFKLVDNCKYFHPNHPSLSRWVIASC